MAQNFSALESEYEDAVRGAVEDGSLAKADAYLASTHAAHRRGSLAWSPPR